MRHATFRFALALLPVIAGCASAPAAGTPEPVQAPSDRIVMTRPDGTPLHQGQGDLAEHTVLHAPLDATVKALAAVYADIGITPNLVDLPTLRVGLRQAVVPKRIADRPLSAYVECGNTFSGPVADEARVTGSVVSAVAAGDSGTSSLSTAISVIARNTTGSSTNAVNCESKGVLEQSIAVRVKAKLGLY